MVDTSLINRVKGTNDVLTEDYRQQQALREALLTHFDRYGYAPIETPIIEHSELYLRKSGEEIVSRMYDFNYQNRRLCLRPEMTASVIRAYVDQMQEQPLPVRLAYAGAAFRYERPQFGRYRQFTQIGAELIGSQELADDNSPTPDDALLPESLADAEIIAMACKALDAFGLEDYRLVIGNVEILLSFLKQIGLKGQLQNFLMLNMENLRTEGVEAFAARVQEVYPEFEYRPYDDLPDDAPAQHSTKLTAMLRQMSEDEAREAVVDFLHSLNITIDSNRSDIEIIDRLLMKIKQESKAPKLNQAVAFMAQLSNLNGEPQAILDDARELLIKHEIDPALLQRTEQLIDHLHSYGIDADKITLNLGLSRGLQYYTSSMFEVHYDALGDVTQICGGGRYNDLVQVLGGRQQLDATGFAFGLERLHLALQMAEKLPTTTKTQPDILVISVTDDDMPYAIDTADQLRQQTLQVELAIRNRSVRNHLQYADKRNIPYVVIIGEDERDNDTLTLRDMHNHEEHRITRHDIADTLNTLGVLA